MPPKIRDASLKNRITPIHAPNGHSDGTDDSGYPLEDRNLESKLMKLLPWMLRELLDHSRLPIPQSKPEASRTDLREEGAESPYERFFAERMERAPNGGSRTVEDLVKNGWYVVTRSVYETWTEWSQASEANTGVGQKAFTGQFRLAMNLRTSKQRVNGVSENVFIGARFRGSEPPDEESNDTPPRSDVPILRMGTPLSEKACDQSGHKLFLKEPTQGQDRNVGTAQRGASSLVSAPVALSESADHGDTSRTESQAENSSDSDHTRDTDHENTSRTEPQTEDSTESDEIRAARGRLADAETNLGLARRKSIRIFWEGQIEEARANLASLLPDSEDS